MPETYIEESVLSLDLLERGHSGVKHGESAYDVHCAFLEVLMITCPLPGQHNGLQGKFHGLFHEAGKHYPCMVAGEDVSGH